MRIALIIPKGSADTEKSFYDYKFYSSFLLSKKYNSYLLAIPTLAALTPPEHEVRVFDENVGQVDFDWNADLVGVSAMTMFAQRAYDVCEQYRSRGAKTVLGGIHPSMCTDEALQHCDALVVGEAENVWLTLLNDVQKGSLNRIYKADDRADLTRSPVPARHSLPKGRYLSDVLQTTKGCPYNCEFCSVYAFDGQKIRNKTVEQVVREIEDIKSSGAKYKKKQAVFFVDDNIIANKKYSRQLFGALKPLNINWMCQASVNISQEDELLALMRESGCGAVFIGFESISKDNLAHMHKAVNKRFDYVDAIRKIQSHGILVHGSFIVGYDSDTPSSFDELIGFIRQSRLLVPIINILTPFPGTRLFDRLQKEGRILHTDWTKYDTKHVVFSPIGASPEELQAGYQKVVKAIYSFDAILDRLNDYWNTDFWESHNRIDPVRFKYRLLFALRLCTLLLSGHTQRSKFIVKILPKVFNRRVRVSAILAQMAYNDFAHSL